MYPGVIAFADETLLKMIKEKLGETEEKLQNRVELLKEWIYTQDHIPKEFEQIYIENFIRVAKFDILKARKKLETYLYAKYNWNDFFDFTRLLCDEVYKFPIHRRCVPARHLTKDGYRIFSATFKSVDAPYVYVEHLLSYAYLIGEYMIRTDVIAGIIFIVDFKDFYTEFLANTNMKTFKMFLEVFLRVMPYRIKNIHFCGLNAASKVLVSVVMKLLPEKTRQKVVYHKTTATLKEYIDVDDLPIDFGGTAESIETVGEDFRKFFMSNRQLVQDITNQKLVAPLPKERANLIGEFETSSLDGSFRKLDID